MIKLREIAKYYSNKFVKTFVLRHINLDVKEGEFITIMGPSGAGKSTLLNILGMLDTASEGEYYFFDEPLHALKEKQRTGIHHQNIGFNKEEGMTILQVTHSEEKAKYENRIISHRRGAIGEFWNSSAPGPLATSLKKDLPQIEHAVRFVSPYENANNGNDFSGKRQALRRCLDLGRASQITAGIVIGHILLEVQYV